MKLVLVTFHFIQSIQNIIISVYDVAMFQVLSSYIWVAIVSDSADPEENISWFH